jgi:hypothetical protein
VVHHPPHHHHLSPERLRSLVYRTHPCLARIVDREDGTWVPTRYGAGQSYGLPQANPGSKMASAGRQWQTNPWVQLRWMRRYAVDRYGSECGAWSFWQAHAWY